MKKKALSYSLLNMLLNNIDIGIVIYDKYGKTIDHNSKARSILRQTEAQLAGDSPIDEMWKAIKPDGTVFPPEEYPFRITLRTGEPFINVIMGINTSGDKTSWVSVNSQKLVDSGDYNVYVIYKDITIAVEAQSNLDRVIRSQKMAEAELAEKMDLVTRTSGIGLWEWNLKTNEIQWDDNICELYGKRKQDFAGGCLTWKKQVHADDIARVEGEIMSCIEEKKDLHTQLRLIWPGGDERMVKMVAIVKKDQWDNPIKMIGTSWDVTEEIMMENALRESENKFREVFRHASTGIGLLSPDGKWLEVNDAACEIVGYSREEMMELTFKDVTYPDDLEESIGYSNKLLNGSLESYRLDKRYVHKNGSIVWVILSVSLLRNEDNTPKFIIAQIVDITLMKYLLNELETKNKILNTTAFDLQNKIAQLEEFSGIISHNVRGPVASIVQLCDYLDSSDSEEKRKKLMSLLKSTTESILETLNDLKEIVDIQMNKELLFDSCSFEESTDRVEQLLQAQIIARKPIINKHFNIKEIKYPKAYLENILYNLVSNAIKYTSKEVVPKIDIHTDKSANGIILKISDNGIGIDLSKYKNQIFKYKKIFHEGFDSTGIGLFLVKNQIETFGGKISVKSEPNKGSTFIIAFKN